MPFVKGFLHVVDRATPGHDLPDTEPPVDPGYGGGIPGLPPFGSTLPEQPPGVWPPISWLNPIQPLPPGSTAPPGAIWPKPPGIDNTLPEPPPGGGETLPVPRVFWMLAYCPTLGWKFVAVDPSLTVGTPLPPAPEPKG